MSGVGIALITTIFWSVGIFPFTEASRRIGAAPVNQYRLLFAWLLISIILLLFTSLNYISIFTNPATNNFIYLGLSGIIGFTIGDYFSFRSFAMLGPKLGSLYTTFAPGAALISGYFILNEKINFTGILGMLVTVGGIAWLSLSRQDKKAAEQAGFTRNKNGFLYGLAGACCQGLGLVLSKLGMQTNTAEQLNTLHAVWIRLLFAFSASFLLSVFSNSFIKNTIPVIRNSKNALFYMLLGTLLGPIAGVYCSLLAIQKLEVAVAQTIFALLPVVVMPINFFIYKEKITWHAVAACLMAISGVLVLIWRESI